MVAIASGSGFGTLTPPHYQHGIVFSREYPKTHGNIGVRPIGQAISNHKNWLRESRWPRSSRLKHKIIGAALRWEQRKQARAVERSDERKDACVQGFGTERNKPNV